MPKKKTAAFLSEGFPPFPNLASDAQDVLRVVEWSEEQLDYKMAQYGAFLQRSDPMPRAVATANWILDRLIFDGACRDGVYDANVHKLEDEICA